MYKHVLVAVDLTQESERIIHKAAELITMNQACVTILHVAELLLDTYNDMLGQNMTVSEHTIREAIFPDLAELAKKQDLPQESVCIEFGPVVDTILNTAERKNADLIMLGSHSRPSTTSLLGSTAYGVLHRATCDVMAVKP